MALALTTVTATQASATTGVASSTTSVSPAAGELVVILASWMFATNVTGVTMTCKDSHSTAFTAGPQHQDAFGIGQAAIFFHLYATAPGATTFTCTNSNTGAADCLITPLRVTGQAAVPNGATMTFDSGSGTAGTTAINHAITTTTPGSFVLYCIDMGGTTALTAVAGCTSLATWNDVSSGDSGGAGHTTAVTGTPGSVTVGFTTTAATAFGMAALEILPSVPSRPQSHMKVRNPLMSGRTVRAAAGAYSR